jgi:hypothetical protein
LTQDPAVFESMERRLALVNLADVDPPAVEQLVFASHPSTVERIAAARVPAGRAVTQPPGQRLPPRPGGIQSFVHNPRSPAG